mgnify:CR=1 FL=1
MGADIKSLRTRIKSVTSTLHLTRAMGLVASSKIRKATERMLHGRDYDAALGQLLAALTADPECAHSPYMQVRDGETRIIVIAGDRGLAGGYNANIFRAAAAHPDARFLPIGKRACDRFAGEVRMCEKFDSADAYALATALCRDFAAGKFARLGILYTRYVSMMSQEPTLRWVLPLTRPENVAPTAILFEPDQQTILRTAVPEYVTGAIMAADNILALFLLPLFGGLSDKVNTRFGRRTPFIRFGTTVAVIALVGLSFVDNMQLIADGRMAVIAIPREVEESIGVTQDDMDNISSFPRTVAGVCMAATLRETADGDTKISVRAVPGYDAAAVCAYFGGGGHKNAAAAQGMDLHFTTCLFYTIPFHAVSVNSRR